MSDNQQLITTEQQDQNDSGDARADAIATTALFTIAIVWVVFWLSGLPS
jgi:hypothetical protein